MVSLVTLSEISFFRIHTNFSDFERFFNEYPPLWKLFGVFPNSPHRSPGAQQNCPRSGGSRIRKPCADRGRTGAGGQESNEIYVLLFLFHAYLCIFIPSSLFNRFMFINLIHISIHVIPCALSFFPLPPFPTCSPCLCRTPSMKYFCNT